MKKQKIEVGIKVMTKDNSIWELDVISIYLGGMNRGNEARVTLTFIGDGSISACSLNRLSEGVADGTYVFVQ